MTERNRDERGRLDSGPVYADSDFLDAVAEIETPTTTKIADRVGCERTTAHGRLRTLEDRGELESENLGNVLVWSFSG